MLYTCDPRHINCPQGLPAGSTTHQFASDLLARLPRGGSSAAAAAAAAQRQRDAEAAAFARKQQQYSLIVDDDEDALEQERRRLQQQEAQQQREQQQDGGGSKADKRRLRRSKQELEGEDETVVKRKGRKRAWEEDEEGEPRVGDRGQNTARNGSELWATIVSCMPSAIPDASPGSFPRLLLCLPTCPLRGCITRLPSLLPRCSCAWTAVLFTLQPWPAACRRRSGSSRAEEG